MGWIGALGLNMEYMIVQEEKHEPYAPPPPLLSVHGLPPPEECEVDTECVPWIVPPPVLVTDDKGWSKWESDMDDEGWDCFTR